MLKRFFEAKSFIFHIPSTKMNIFWIFLNIVHVHAPCMYSMHVFYACTLSMYSMHVFYTGHLVDPQGPFGRMFRKLRIQGRMQIFEKMSQKALNRVLTLAKDSRSRELSKSSGIIDLQNVWFCE